MKTRKCVVCGEDYMPNRDFQKYCKICAALVQRERARKLTSQNYYIMKNIFKVMPEEEKLRRMNNIAKILLEAEDKKQAESELNKEEIQAGENKYNLNGDL